MTAYRFVTLTCDGCGEINDPGTVRTIREARAIAKSEGWLYRDGQDLCPICGRGWVRLAYGYYADPNKQ